MSKLLLLFAVAIFAFTGVYVFNSGVDIASLVGFKGGNRFSDTRVLHQVERVEWNPHLPFSKEVSRMRTPVILTNTMASRWKAIQRWSNPAYLQNQPTLQMMNDVQIGPENTFGFIDNKTALAQAKLPGIELSMKHRNINTTSEEFFRLFHGGGEYVYWYGKVEGALKGDVIPNRFLWLDIEDESRFGLFMWLGAEDVRSPIHYDQDHNFFVQVSGKKRFVLFPPWEWKELHPYPRIHPQWHKSHILWQYPDLTKTPYYQNAEGYEAMLSPGDVLYVPPYWWHHVHSITPCVSLASWSSSEIAQNMKPMYERQIGYEHFKDPVKKTAAVYSFIWLLLERIYGEKEIVPFVQTMLKVRFDPMKEVFERLPSLTDPAFCQWKDSFSVEDFRDQLDKSVEFSVQQLNQCQGPATNTKWKDVRAIRDLEVMDFIEMISSEVVGGENVYSFFLRCF